jgi:predicted ATPase
VVDEAATDVIAREQALGRGEPWRDAEFVNAIALLQQQRQEQTPPAYRDQVLNWSTFPPAQPRNGST